MVITQTHYHIIVSLVAWMRPLEDQDDFSAVSNYKTQKTLYGLEHQALCAGLNKVAWLSLLQIMQQHTPCLGSLRVIIAKNLLSVARAPDVLQWLVQGRGFLRCTTA